MTGLTTHRGKIAVYAADHVDTDQIVPARFLSRVSREGYGELLFADLRGESFPLDRPEARGATILVVGTNFGCGSSREHAVWAIQQAGFRAVVARREEKSPGFSDIFRQNAANCGLLLIELPPDDHARLVEAGSGAEVEIDLPAQKVVLGEREMTFAIDEATKKQLVEGLDLIGTTLRHEEAIQRFEERADLFVPTRASEATAAP